jgi:hypothetical protein
MSRERKNVAYGKLWRIARQVDRLRHRGEVPPRWLADLTTAEIEYNAALAAYRAWLAGSGPRGGMADG